MSPSRDLFLLWPQEKSHSKKQSKVWARFNFLVTLNNLIQLSHNLPENPFSGSDNLLNSDDRYSLFGGRTDLTSTLAPVQTFTDPEGNSFISLLYCIKENDNPNPCKEEAWNLSNLKSNYEKSTDYYINWHMNFRKISCTLSYQYLYTSMTSHSLVMQGNFWNV